MTLESSTDRHPSSQRFHDILNDLGKLHDRKQADYGTDDDPFANLRAAKDFGEDEVLGVAIRMNDKMNRIKTYFKKGGLVNDSIKDDFEDIAVYSAICLVFLQERHQTEEVVTGNQGFASSGTVLLDKSSQIPPGIFGDRE